MLDDEWKKALPAGIETKANNPYAPRAIASGIEGIKGKKQ